MANRCNNKVNCDDGADEEGCDLVIVPRLYSSRISPPTENCNEPLSVQVNVIILRVKSIDFTEFQYSIEMIVTHQWNDSRLKFRNLKNDPNMNKFSVYGVVNSTEVWLPETGFEGAEFTACDVEERFKDVRVVKKTLPLEDDLKNVAEGKAYMIRI